MRGRGILCVMLFALLVIPCVVGNGVKPADPGKPKPPEPPPPPISELVLVDTPQLAIGGYQNRVYLLECLAEDMYEASWISAAETCRIVSLGDVDRDGDKEILSIYWQTESLTRSKKPTTPPLYLYTLWFNIWKNGSMDQPSYTSPASTYIGRWSPHDLEIGNADNDVSNRNEIVICFDSYIAILAFNLESQGIEWLWTSEDVQACVFSVTVGDVDNDGVNELVGASGSNGVALIWEWDGTTWTGAYATQSIGSCALDDVRIGDVDGDGKKELVAGGNSNRVAVWKHNEITGDYEIMWVSQNLGGFVQGLGVGDVDGDGVDEIIAGTAQYDQRVYVIEYVGPVYSVVWTYYAGIAVTIGGIAIGNLDGGTDLEFVVSGAPAVSIFKCRGDNVYTLVWRTDSYYGQAAIG